MNTRHMVPFRSQERDLAERGNEEFPFLSLQRQMNRLFDDFFEGFELAPFSGEGTIPSALTPRIDVSETDSEFHISAELPGIDEKDVDVTLSDRNLTISGEKKLEKDEKKKDYHRVERSYGSFQRSIPLTAEVDAEKVDATFRQGVLEIVLPKAKPSSTRRKVAVKPSK